MHTSEFPPVAVELATVEATQPAAPVAPSFGPRRALWIVLSYILTQFLVAFPLGIAFGIAHMKLSAAPMMLITIVGAVAGTAVAWRMARVSFGSQAPLEFRDTLGVRSTTQQQIAIAVAVGLLLSAFNGLVLISVFPPSSTQDLGPLDAAMNEGGWARLMCTFFAVCVAPPTEEFMFRGVLFAGLARRLPATLAASISIGAFVLMHVNSASPYWPGLFAVSLVGQASQLARMKTGSLVPGIALHTAYNAALFVLAYQQQP
ncbi:MAG TPA: CPBP family intramembrane glutamic endopeptidase [Polyangiales bacterium]|nr:CPBP family intramembrane glutamic endopeptidase [Polyangiales bacterium]